MMSFDVTKPETVQKWAKWLAQEFNATFHTHIYTYNTHIYIQHTYNNLYIHVHCLSLAVNCLTQVLASCIPFHIFVYKQIRRSVN